MDVRAGFSDRGCGRGGDRLCCCGSDNPGVYAVFRRGRDEQDAKEQIRLRLGRWLAVALELELAADILRTAIAPTWNEIGQLAAIVILRTVLNYFLQKEIDKAASRNTAASLNPVT